MTSTVPLGVRASSVPVLPDQQCIGGHRQPLRLDGPSVQGAPSPNGIAPTTLIPRPPPERRPRDRAVVLDRAECASLLEGQKVGRLGFIVDGWPVVLPMNYLLESGEIVLRTDSGTKLSALRHGAQVSFQVDSVDPLYRSGWSVLIFGLAVEVIDASAIALLRSLGLSSWEDGDKDSWIRIRPVQITGRRLPKAWRYPDSTSEP